VPRALVLAPILAVVVALLMGVGSLVGEAAPDGSPVALGTAACPETSRSPEELGALLESVFATPAAVQGVATSPTPFLPPVGKPADAATVAAVQATVDEWFACINEGRFPALLAIYTDEAAVQALGEAMQIGEVVNANQTGTPANRTSTPSEATIRVYLTALSRPLPSDDADRETPLAVHDVTLLADGRVGAIVEWRHGPPGNRVQRSFVRLRNVDGRYRIDVGGADIGDAGGTPAAGTPAA
jgi:hypothetical protein